MVVLTSNLQGGGGITPADAGCAAFGLCEHVVFLRPSEGCRHEYSCKSPRVATDAQVPIVLNPIPDSPCPPKGVYYSRTTAN
eukprot:scaffold114734_cov33-Tisochrysis_lutea.AAC.4